MAAGYLLQKVPYPMVQELEAEILSNASKMMGTKCHNYFQGFLAKVGFASGFYIMHINLH